MSANPDVNYSEDRLFSLWWGLVYKAVCAPAHWDAQRVSDEATKAAPPGTTANRWVVTSTESMDDDHPFNSGNPQPCPDCADRRHWIVNC